MGKKCGVFQAFVGMLVFAAIPGSSLGDQFDVNAFLDEFGSVDIGEETAFTEPDTVPPLPPIDALLGPISSGVVTGQFEITCGSGNETGCDSSAFFAENFDWRWGLLDVNSMQFVESPGGDTFFGSAFADEGFTSVDTLNDQRFVHFEFELQDSGITLEPSHDYVFFAGLSADLKGANRVPGEGDNAFNPEGAVHTSAAIDAPPFQLHQGSPTEFVDSINLFIVTQVATSRQIPIIPEPSVFALFIVGAACLWQRRRTAS